MEIAETHRRTIASMLMLAMLTAPGCSVLAKQFGNQPVSARAPQPPQPVPNEGSPQSESNGFLGRTKAVIGGTGKVIGGTIAVVGAFALMRWLDDDDDEDEPMGFDPDPLWHAGYGFNNPNNERMRNGEPLLNFDGSVAD